MGVEFCIENSVLTAMDPKIVGWRDGNARADDALETIDLLYRAAVEPQLWPEALERFAHAVGCMGMAMISITPMKTTGLIVSPSMREAAIEYKQEWWRYDTRVGRIFALQLSRGVFAEAQLFTVDELARDPIRQEFSGLSESARSPRNWWSHGRDMSSPSASSVPCSADISKGARSTR